MKKTVIAGACLIGVVLAAPYVTGSIAESETRNLLADMNQKSAEYGVTKITSYERGYKSSQVAYEYEMPAGLAALTDFKGTILYNCDYSHGFTGIDYSCNFQQNEGYQTFLQEEFGGEDPISITGGISAFGGLTQEITSKAINKTMDDGSVLKLAPSEIIVESGGDFSAYDVVAKLGALDMSSNDGSLVLSESEMDWQIETTDLGLFVGDYSMSMDSMKFSEGESSSADIKDIVITGSTSERGDKIDSTVVFELGSLDSQSEKPVALKNAKMTADILGVDAQALAEYQEFARNMQTEMIASLEKQGEPDVDPTQMMAILPILEKMLDKGLTIKLAAAGELMDEPNAIELDIKLLEKTSFTQLSAFMFDPESVLKSFDIRLNSSLNDKFLASEPMLKAMISKSPLFEQDGDDYETKVKIGEQSEVNGKKVSFQELQGMVMSGMM